MEEREVGKRMNKNSLTTVFTAFFFTLFLAGQACAMKSEPEGDKFDKTATSEEAVTPISFQDVSIPDDVAVKEPAKSDKPQEVVVAHANKSDKTDVIVVAQKKKPGKEKKGAAPASSGKGKVIELQKFTAQSGLSFKFNRLLKQKLGKNLPPVKDGIHDPQNPASILLQTPKEGMAGYVKVFYGNRVDWVKTLNRKIINPRASLEDPTEEMDIFEVNVVRIPVGSMPKVVFPHDRHTAWLGCENCHDSIFVPEAGANDISMEMIIRGEKCGVCHGKVAFPVSQCGKCHSLRKTKEEKAALGIK